MLLMANPRRSVVFTAKQLTLLKDMAARLGITVGEMVRRIVDGFFTTGAYYSEDFRKRKRK
jgi:hypothetical protein